MVTIQGEGAVFAPIFLFQRDHGLSKCALEKRCKGRTLTLNGCL